MNNPYKVIFVCEWNTCRSAMAKYIFRDLVKKSELADKIFIDSAGFRLTMNTFQNLSLLKNTTPSIA